MISEIIKMISVIIPAFNEESYIVRLLHSLKKQTLNAKKFEVIVVDNGSNDKTKNKVENFKMNNSDFNIRLIEQLKRGVCLARNKGADIAKGDIFLFLDADNIADKNLLKEVEDKVNAGFLAGTIYILPIEKSFKGYLIYQILELIKLYSPRPFGKNFCAKKVFLSVGGYNNSFNYLGTNLEFLRRVNKYLIKNNKTLGHIRTPIYTSLRRFEKKGYINTLSKWLLAYLGIRGIHYPPINS